MTTSHPVDDGLGDYIVDPGTAINIVSMLLQLVLSLVGPDKAKASLDWEVARLINASADASKIAVDQAASEILKQRGLV